MDCFVLAWRDEERDLQSQPYLVCLNGLSTVGLNASHTDSRNQDALELASVCNHMRPMAHSLFLLFKRNLRSNLDVFLLPITSVFVIVMKSL